MNIEEVYDAHVDRVYKYFYIQCHERCVAEDLTSQTFMQMLQRMQGDDVVIEDHKKYLYGIMRNVWMGYLRQKYRRGEYLIADETTFPAHVEQEVDRYKRMTPKQRALSYIERLPDKQAQVVRMRLIDELSVAQVADALGHDKNYVKTTQSRGLRRLRELVRNEGVSLREEAA